MPKLRRVALAAAAACGGSSSSTPSIPTIEAARTVQLAGFQPEVAPRGATGHGHSRAAIVTAALVVGAWLLLTALVLFRRRRLRRGES